jgi:hypothetical protein
MGTRENCTEFGPFRAKRPYRSAAASSTISSRWSSALAKVFPSGNYLRPPESIRMNLSYADTAHGVRLDVAVTMLCKLRAEQQARLVKIVNKCPVHRILSSSAKINTRLNGERCHG